MARQLVKGIAGLGALVLMSACMKGLPQEMTPRSHSAQVTRAPAPQSFAQANGSQIIESLQFRQSVLAEGSSFDTVAQAVLAANARPAEADLRAARLRAEAASKNWLPKIGPSISLTSLSSVAAQLLVQQVVFDNGKAKAERAFAAADVEAVAVTLSTTTNDRVLEALTLYLRAEQAREAAHVSDQARKRMVYFHSIMGERVNGGVSDISDLRVLANKLAEAENRVIADQEDAQVALAELDAMAARSLADLRGLPDLDAAPTGIKPLSVLHAEAVRGRDIAQATIDRANLLPGATLNGAIGDGGDVSLDVSGQQLVGLGTGASLEAIQAAKDAADRRVAQASEDTNRKLRRLSQQLTSLQRQEDQAKTLAEAARQNQILFQQQFEAGARPIMDVISNYETAMRLERDYVRVKYDRFRVRLEIASVFGALVDGADI
ncbi:MAG: TolC family protein [Pseudomonadota bacterium]